MRWLITFVLLLMLQGSALARRYSRKRSTGLGCSLNLTSESLKNDPVIVIGHGKSSHLAFPKDDTGTLQLHDREHFVLACPGRNNKLQDIHGSPSLVIATCRNSHIKVDESSYSVEDLGCSKKVSGVINNTGSTCGPGHAQLLQLGYSLQNKWYPLVFVCHIQDLSISLFAKHILHGKEIKGTGKQPSTRPSFLVGGNFYPGFSPEVIYKRANQKITFQKLLNSTNLVEKYLSATFIARGHLAPDADFILPAYQGLTYFYVNTGPQWQSVNGGNWLSLENTIRILAKDKEIDLQIITGTYEILQLEDKYGKPTDMYLNYDTQNNTQLPIPKFFWKIIYTNETREGIAFVLLNNPFVDRVTSDDMLCADICEESKWLPKSKVWRRISNGYLYCCEVDSLKKVVSFIPKLNTNDILKGPN